MFLVSGTDTSDADKEECHYLAVNEVSIMIDEPLFDSTVNVAKYTAKAVKHGWVKGIFKELHQNGDIDDCPEYFVRSLKLFTFFHELRLF